MQASVVPDSAGRTVLLLFSRAGLGFQSASRTHSAIWAVVLEMVQQRHPEVARLIVGEMHHGTRSESIRGVVQCEGILRTVGFDTPKWETLTEGGHPVNPDPEGESVGNAQHHPDS